MQKKVRGWAAGSKREKCRGLSDKKQDLVLIVFELPELRVDSRKDEGLFNKMSRPKGYARI